MEQFRLDFEGINRTIKIRALTMVPILLIAMLFMLYISAARSGRAIEAFPSLTELFVAIIFMSTVVYFGSRGFRRSLESYTITFDGDIITREQHDTPTITFTKADITEIARDKKGSYRIKAETWRSPLNIPTDVEDAERLYQLLCNIKPITEKSSHDSFLKQIVSVSGIVVFILTFALFELSKDKIVVVTCGVMLVGAIIYSIIQIRKDKNVNYTTKDSLWLRALFLISIVIRIYNNLMT